LVLKVIKTHGDEWNQGDILAAFGGRGMVRVLKYAGGAVLLERSLPGYSLRELALNDRDDEATDVLAGVISRMSPEPSGVGIAAQELAAGFGRYLRGADRRIPRLLVEEAQQLWNELCRTQIATRLLHGDLHHENVIFDIERGWLAIDPKG